MTVRSLQLEGMTGHGSHLVPAGRPWLVGRGASADITIPDPAVSRHHAEVELTAAGLRVRDLGSANGTFINGAPVSEGHLRPGDTLTFGRPAFRLVDPATAPAGDATEAQRGWRIAAGADTSSDRPQLLQQLLHLARSLSGSFALDPLCAQIVDLAFDVVTSDRVALLVARGPDGSLVPVRSRSRVGEDAAVRVPQAIAGRAATERRPVLTESALGDEALQSASVEAARVRSAIAVPLLAEDEVVVGVLYADRIARLDPFTDADAHAMLAFAGLAAVSLAKLELLESLERRRETQRNLERFFAPEVAATIAAAEGPLAAGGDRRVVTVLFSDIRDFTPLAESLPPEEVAALLTEYFTVMADLVFAHGGTLDKFLGDGLLAVWGAPLDLADASAQAVAAARAMRRAVEELNRDWNALGKPSLGVGYGLARGVVFAGRIGSEHRLDYTVIGDVVNVASRLCKVARAGEILVTGAVHEDAPGLPGVRASPRGHDPGPRGRDRDLAWIGVAEMRVVLQRVTRASVTVDGAASGTIGAGYCLLVGFTHADTASQVQWMAEKIAGLRLFADAEGKMNLGLAEVGGGLLVVSQFTLYGDAAKGRRPSFLDAAPPELAIPLYEQFLAALRDRGLSVATGVFGAMMEVEIHNDGPVTLILERT